MKYYQINYDIVIVLIDRLEISDISLPNLYLHSKETSTSPFSNSHWDSPTTWDLPESRDKFSWKTDEILQFQFANTKSFFFFRYAKQLRHFQTMANKLYFIFLSSAFILSNK